MVTLDEYFINYHHGGTLLKEDVKYENGAISEFLVDPDKLCHWDLSGDVKELGYEEYLLMKKRKRLEIN